MTRFLIILITALMAFPLFAQEDSGDVCNIRPDLCDEGGGTPEPEVAPSAYNRPRPQRRPSKNLEQRRRRVKPAQNKTTTRHKRRAENDAKCVPLGEQRTVNTQNLPVCGGVSISEQAPDETAQSAAKHARRSPASAINVDSYLSANANHPAFSRKLAGHQAAFADTSRAATIGLPAQDAPKAQEAVVAPSDSGAVPAAAN